MELVPGILSFFSGLGVKQNIPVTSQGWGRLKWGMNFDTVKTNYPQASEISGRKLEYTPDSSPPGRNFKYTFEFDSGHQLDSVTLDFSGSSETADYADLVEQISRQLGAPVSSTATSTTWNQDQTQVNLSSEPDGGIVLSEIA
jgi:hypothetical protein